MYHTILGAPWLHNQLVSPGVSEPVQGWPGHTSGPEATGSLLFSLEVEQSGPLFLFLIHPVEFKSLFNWLL